MGSSARKILNIVTAVVMVVIAASLLTVITTLIVRNLAPKNNSGAADDMLSQESDSITAQIKEAEREKPPEKENSGSGELLSASDDQRETEGPGAPEALPGTEDTVSDNSGTAIAEREEAEEEPGGTEDAGTIPDDTHEIKTEAPEHNNSIQSGIDTIAVKYGAVGLQIAVIKNGVITGAYVYGDAVRGSTPMTIDTKIRVASVSKVILTMAIMRLCELGLLDIDADIGDYWGAPVRNPNHSEVPVTMRQILSHTSSIIVYDYGFSADGELVRRRFLDGSCFGRNTPGAIGSWNYNNYAFAALGLTVEVAMDETVNSIASRYLFSPLGIDAAFGSGSISDTSNIATLYTNGGGVGRSDETQRGTLGSTFPGERGEEFPGGLTISAYDLAKLIAVLAGRGQYGGVRILTDESVSLMESSQGRTGGFEQCLPLRRRANLYGKEELCYHTGSNYGVYNLISYDPVTGDGVVVLTSGASGATDAYGIYAICGEISEYVYRNM